MKWWLVTFRLWRCFRSIHAGGKSPGAFGGVVNLTVGLFVCGRDHWSYTKRHISDGPCDGDSAGESSQGQNLWRYNSDFKACLHAPYFPTRSLNFFWSVDISRCSQTHVCNTPWNWSLLWCCSEGLSWCSFDLNLGLERVKRPGPELEIPSDDTHEYKTHSPRPSADIPSRP